MRSGVRRGRRKQNKGLKLLLGVIVAVFAVILITVGIKFALSGLDGLGKDNNKKEDDKNKVLVTGIELNCDRPVVRAGEQLPLEVKVTPENATDPSLTWTVSGDMGTVSEDGVFTPSAEAGKSETISTASLEPALKFLEKHIFDPDLKIGKLHDLCGISDTYFRQLFLARFGISPKKYVIKRRLAQAKAISDSGEYDTIGEVAMMTGFEDALYFSKAFRNKYGYPPSSW